jgi:hypothetical protein
LIGIHPQICISRASVREAVEPRERVWLTGPADRVRFPFSHTGTAR